MPLTKRILVVDDDQDIREGLRGLLELEGYRVSCAEDGQIALDWLRTTFQKPDLILLDLMLPEKNGFQFRVEQIADTELKEIPVVIMSGGQYSQAEILETAALDYIKKPTDVGTILKTLQRHLV